MVIGVTMIIVKMYKEAQQILLSYIGNYKDKNITQNLDI